MMNKEEFINKLESVKTPDLVVKGHKERLKFVLLNMPSSAHSVEKLKTPVSISARIRAWIDSSRQPAWKLAVVGSMATFVVAAIIAIGMFLTVSSPAAVAADIVKRDPAVQQKLSGSGEIIIIRVDVKDRTANVICGRGQGDFMEAEVDLEVRTVVSVRHYEGIFMLELPLQEQSDAIKIALSDPKVKDMIDKGGKIGRVFPSFSSISSMTIVNGNMVKVTPATNLVIVPIDVDGKIWLIQVNLTESKTERILEPQFKQLSENDFRLITEL
jgi:hypothetical protein